MDMQGRELAVKQVFTANKEILDREIEIHSHIGQHPNIVQLVDTFPIEGAEGKMIVMELAKGGELGDLLEKSGPMPEVKAKHIFKQVVSAIQHLHARNVLHRDLKSDNILLCTDSTHDMNQPVVTWVARVCQKGDPETSSAPGPKPRQLILYLSGHLAASSVCR